MQVFLTTTGTQTNTTINDLGKAVFVHPKTNIPLIEPLGEFTEKDISTSSGLIAAVASGFITLTNIDGSNITTLTDITNKTNDHGNQTGLLDDDHTQYLNNTRGDARYLTKTLANGNIFVGSGSTAASVTMSGDATIDNTGVLTLNNLATPGTYRSVTVNAKGRVTSGTNPSTLAGYQISDAQPINGNLTELSNLSTTGLLSRNNGELETVSLTGGFNRISITNPTGFGNPLIDISSVYAGQNTITTVGTISSGVWNGTTIAIANGGTGSQTRSDAWNSLIPPVVGNFDKVLVATGTSATWQTYDLQKAYNASTSTEIVTNATLGALTVRRGSAADTDKVLDVFDGAGTSTFDVLGNGRVNIKKPVGGLNLSIAPVINDPNMGTKDTTVYIETTQSTTTDALRVYHTAGVAGTSGYTSLGFNGSAPELTLLDMDDDPSYITFSIARLGLATTPGTFAAPSIISKFGARGAVNNGLTGFSWLTNDGTSGSAPVEIMSCDKNFLAIPATTTALRAAPAANGMIAYNSSLNKVDAYENGAWTQFVDTTTNQTIAGNKTFTGKITANTDIQQYFNSTSVTTTINTFALIPGMTLTTTNLVTATYEVHAILNFRNTTTNSTVVEIQIFVNGVADADTLLTFTMASIVPMIIPIRKIYTNTAPSTVYTVRWRRVSGTATPTITNKKFIIQELL
jgi:hypothetical protein